MVKDVKTNHMMVRVWGQLKKGQVIVLEHFDNKCEKWNSHSTLQHILCDYDVPSWMIVWSII